MAENLYIDALVNYAKQSGAFEWAAKQYHADRGNVAKQNAFLSTYSLLSSFYYPQIVNLYNSNPKDKDAISVYDIARVDFQLMTLIYNNIRNNP